MNLKKKDMPPGFAKWLVFYPCLQNELLVTTPACQELWFMWQRSNHFLLEQTGEHPRTKADHSTDCCGSVWISFTAVQLHVDQMPRGAYAGSQVQGCCCRAAWGSSKSLLTPFWLPEAAVPFCFSSLTQVSSNTPRQHINKLICLLNLKKFEGNWRII